MAIKLGELLLKEKLVTPEQLDEALKTQTVFGIKLGSSLVELGFITDEQLCSFLSRKLGVPVYVIGLGNRINASELTTIASAGGGRFISNPDPAQVSTLFGQVAREFTTIRRDGITMPLPPGDHEYLEEVTVGGATARVRFQFHAGDAGAAVKASSIAAD